MERVRCDAVFIRGLDALAFRQYMSDYGLNKKASAAGRIISQFLRDAGYPRENHKITAESLIEMDQEEPAALQAAA